MSCWARSAGSFSNCRRVARGTPILVKVMKQVALPEIKSEFCMLTPLVLLAVFTPSQSPDKPLAPWGANRHATDAAKRHVEEIAVGRHAYVVRQGGTMDGTNCR